MSATDRQAALLRGNARRRETERREAEQAELKKAEAIVTERLGQGKAQAGASAVTKIQAAQILGRANFDEEEED